MISQGLLSTRFRAARDRRSRYRLYLAVAGILLVAALLARGYQAWRSGEPLNFVHSDAKGYYVYLPTILIDRDLDFSNQMTAHWGKELDTEELDPARRTATGMVGNKYPIGMALSLLPAFAAAHGLSIPIHQLSGSETFAPNGYTLLYQLLCLVLILAFGCAAMILIDRLLEDHFDLDGIVIALGIVTFWLGSHYTWYFMREPFMVHVVSSFWVTATIYLCAGIRRDAHEGKLPLRSLLRLSFASSMAIVCRPTNLFVLPFLVWAVVPIIERGLLARLMKLIPIAAIGLMPVVLQLGVWRVLHGDWLHYSYEDERFVWHNPALLLTLFSLRKGLFVWTPILLLAVAGLLWHRRGAAREQRGFIACGLLASGILWYFNSAWWCWGFGWSFGGRAFLELSAIFVIGLALSFEWARRQPAVVRRGIAAAVLLMVAYNYVLMGLYQSGRIDRGSAQAGAWNLEGAPRRELIKLERALRESRQANINP